MKRKIKWFSNNNGYGYIEYKEDGKVIIYLSTENDSKEIELTETKKEA